MLKDDMTPIFFFTLQNMSRRSSFGFTQDATASQKNIKS